jgi:hypothetical protein
MTDSYRVYVELPNGAKFRAQGETSEVRQDVDRFYALLLSVPKPPVKTVNANGNSAHHEEPQDEIAADGVDQRSLPMDGLDQVTLDRLFAKDRTGTISLRALPRGDAADADALVALIYGAGRLSNEQQVTGSRLMKAAVQSGLQIDRIDRALTTQIGPFVTTAGFKKGRRYGLTNPGIRRAEEILTAILG